MNSNIDIIQQSGVHASWQPIIARALSTMDQRYTSWLESDDDWLPGINNLFAAFREPLESTKYILFGESPYPRKQSANGYAFWDAAVSELWSQNGLSTTVNKATSLRNFIKMLLLASGALHPQDLSQPAIAALDKTQYIATGSDLFQSLIQKGFLLLNASLVLSQKPVSYDAKAWYPFMAKLLQELNATKPDITLILFGKVAQQILSLDEAQSYDSLQAEHPYNVSFIKNPMILEFFKPFNLLNKMAVVN